jgi:TP901 family phage tail tape measure protein
MPRSFILNAELKINPPKNLATLRADIQKALNGLTPDINLKFNANSAQEVSKQIRKVKKDIDDTTKSSKDLGTSLVRFGEQVGRSAVRLAAFGAVALVFLKVKDAVSEAAKSTLDYQHELVRLGQVGDSTGAEISQLSKTVRELSVTLGTNANELLKTATTLRQAGISIGDIQKLLGTLAKTELAPNFKDLKSTAEGIIALRSQFGQTADEIERSIGSINKVSATYAVESEDLIEAIRKSGGAFKEAGGNLNELIALMTTARSTTRESADTIATGFRTIFARLQRTDTVEQLKQLGVNLRFTADEARKAGTVVDDFVGPFEAIQRISARLSKESPQSALRAQIVSLVAGDRQISKIIPLLENAAGAQEAYNLAKRSTGSLDIDAIKAQASLQVQLNKTTQSFNDLFATFARNQSLQDFVKLALQAAQAAAELAKVLAPLAPILIGLVLAKSIPVFKGAAVGVAKFANRSPKYASGGPVGGTGNTDSVPAMLMPGEFVINKQSAQRIGYNQLEHMNKYAGGGKVSKIKKIKDIGKAEVSNLKNTAAFNILTNTGASDIIGSGPIIGAMIAEYGIRKGLKKTGITKHFAAGGPVDPKDTLKNLLSQLGIHGVDIDKYVNKFEVTQQHKYKNAAGSFSPGKKLIKISDPNDASTLFHEFLHAVDLSQGKTGGYSSYDPKSPLGAFGAAAAPYSISDTTLKNYIKYHKVASMAPEFQSAAIDKIKRHEGLPYFGQFYAAAKTGKFKQVGSNPEVDNLIKRFESEVIPLFGNLYQQPKAPVGYSPHDILPTFKGGTTVGSLHKEFLNRYGNIPNTKNLVGKGSGLYGAGLLGSSGIKFSDDVAQRVAQNPNSLRLEKLSGGQSRQYYKYLQDYYGVKTQQSNQSPLQITNQGPTPLEQARQARLDANRRRQVGIVNDTIPIGPTPIPKPPSLRTRFGQAVSSGYDKVDKFANVSASALSNSKVGRFAKSAYAGASAFSNSYAPYGVAAGLEYGAAAITPQNTTQAGFKGALQGAGLGISVGAAFGPLGIAIGGTVGAFVSAKNAIKEFADETRKTDIAKAIGEYGQAVQLNKESKGKFPVNFEALVGTGINKYKSDLRDAGEIGFIDEVKQGFLQTFGSLFGYKDQNEVNKQFEDLSIQQKEQFATQFGTHYGDAVQQEIDRLAQQSTTVDEFLKKGGQARIKDLGGLGIPGINESSVFNIVAQGIKNRDLASKAATTTNELITSFDNISKAVEATTINFASLDSRLEASSTLFGNIAPGKIDRSKGLDLFGSSNTKQFNNTVDLLTGSIGNNELSRQFGSTLKESNIASQALKPIFDELTKEVNKNGLSEGFRKKILGTNLSDDFKSRLITGFAGSVGQLEQFDFNKKFKESPEKFIKEFLEKTFPNSLENAKSVLKDLDEQINKFTDDTVQYNERLNKVSDAVHILDNLKLNTKRFSTQQQANFYGRPSDALDLLSINDLQTPFIRQQQRLTGLNAGAIDPNIIGQELQATLKEIDEVTESRKNLTGKPLAETTTKLIGLRNSAQNLQKALENLTDTSKTTAGAQEKLGKVQEDKSSRKDFVERFITAPLEGRLELQRSAGLTQSAFSQGTIRNLLPNDQSSVIQFLRSLGKSSLPGLGGVNAQDLADYFVKEFGGGITNNGLDQQEQVLQNFIGQNLQIAEQAQNQLVNVLGSQNNDFFNRLQSNQKTFLDQLSQNFDHLIQEEQSKRDTKNLDKLKNFFGMSTGGMIMAAGGRQVAGFGTDTIPALLSQGEYVVNSNATKKHLPLLKAINAQKLAGGGYLNRPISGPYKDYLDAGIVDDTGTRLSPSEVEAYNFDKRRSSVQAGMQDALNNQQDFIKAELAASQARIAQKTGEVSPANDTPPAAPDASTRIPLAGFDVIKAGDERRRKLLADALSKQTPDEIRSQKFQDTRANLNKPDSQNIQTAKDLLTRVQNTKSQEQVRSEDYQQTRQSILPPGDEQIFLRNLHQEELRNSLQKKQARRGKRNDGMPAGKLADTIRGFQARGLEGMNFKDQINIIRQQGNFGYEEPFDAAKYEAQQRAQYNLQQKQYRLHYNRMARKGYFATGGSVPPARGTDTIPARLTPGEFVVNANAAQKNKASLEYMNSGGEAGANSNNDSLTKAFQQFGEDSKNFLSSFTLTSKLLEGTFNNFNQSAKELGDALKNINISVERKGSVEILINGAETLSRIKGDLENYIKDEIVKSVQALKTNIKFDTPGI